MKQWFKVFFVLCIWTFLIVWSLLPTGSTYLPTSAGGREQCGCAEHTQPKPLVALWLRGTLAAFTNSFFSPHPKTSANQSLSVETCSKANTWEQTFNLFFFFFSGSYAGLFSPHWPTVLSFSLSLIIFILFMHWDRCRGNWVMVFWSVLIPFWSVCELPWICRMKGAELGNSWCLVPIWVNV